MSVVPLQVGDSSSSRRIGARKAVSAISLRYVSSNTIQLRGGRRLIEGGERAAEEGHQRKTQRLAKEDS